MNKTRKEPHPNVLNQEPFTNTKETWNIFKIIAELVEGYERLDHVRPAVSIFGSARTKANSEIYKLTVQIAEALSNEGFSIITGGGPGIMEAANVGASKGNSLSIGLNIDLPHEQSSNEHLDIMLRHRYFFTRKAMFIKHSLAYIIMPGGFGTLDELFDIATLVQTKKKQFMPLILVGRKFWGGLKEWIEETMLTYETISSNDPNLLIIADTIDEVVGIVKKHYSGTKLPHSKIDFEF